MSQYKTFSFDYYSFDPSTKTLIFNYSVDDKINFVEQYQFDLELDQNVDEKALDRACKIAFLVAGVSYYKTFLPPNITYRNIEVDQSLADFLSKTYQKGLGEFFYINNLDPQTKIVFPSNSGDLIQIISSGKGALIGIGGGKDSLVTVEKLKDNDISTWSVRHHSQQLQPLLDVMKTRHYPVTRKIDDQLLDKSLPGAYNGHVPVSAVFACIGVVLAILAKKRDVIVSNEASANEATLLYKGVEINHQYSKSLEFEKDFQNVLEKNFGESIRYFSYLRNLSELQICEIFSQYFDKYSGVFSSCNKAFTQSSSRLYWCGKCPKCAFIYLAMANYIDENKMRKLFNDKILLLDPDLQETYKMLLGMNKSKPLECVGTIDECRFAMSNLIDKYPELKNFFVLDNNYNHDYRAKHSIPDGYEPL